MRHLTIFFSLKLQHCSCDHLEKVSFEILIVGLGSRPMTSIALLGKSLNILESHFLL